MGWENFRQKSGCLCVKAIDEATIREAVKNGTMMEFHHQACPLSCPCKICEFIENKEDPKFLLQDLVQVGERQLKEKESQEKDTEAILAKTAVHRLESQDDSTSPGSPAGSSLRSPSKKGKQVKAVNYEVEGTKEQGALT